MEKIDTLKISDIICKTCFCEIKHSIGYSFAWNGIYDISSCKCGKKVQKKSF